MLQFSPDLIHINDYKYVLPDEMIARFPLENRSGSKLLIYDRGTVSHTTFSNITELAGNGGLLIFNNTRVIQARILMYKETGSKIEIFLLEPFSPAEYNLAFSSSPGCVWKCMVGNKKKWKGGELTKAIEMNGEKIFLSARIIRDHGSWQEILFVWEPGCHPFSRVIDVAGLTPIPPYLNRMPADSDKLRYQTVYSKFEGSVAAPTAGLHFTSEILDAFKKNGTLSGEITLHVGAGTFQPVKSATAGEHPMHAEHFSVSAEIIKKIRNNLGVITAVGTTSMRALESIYWLGVKQLYLVVSQNASEEKQPCITQPHSDEFMQRPGGRIKDEMQLSQWEHLELPQDVPASVALDALSIRLAKDNLKEIEAKTEMMIIPGYKFRIASKLITNFHQPGSTLLLLIAAFIGKEWRKVYDYALTNNFRFLSYGDSSLLIPEAQSDIR